MKTIMINCIKSGIIILVLIALTSCRYDEIAKADYPDELIYLPAALQGIYAIDDVPTATLFDPTPGNSYRFTVNTVTNEFNVPLSVYRSGITNEKLITIDIAVHADTISTLIATDTLNMKNTELLPAGKYSIPSTVQVKSGSELGSFNLLVDLNFLKANAPKKYALGITVSSIDSKSNPLYKTVIVLIDTKIMNPLSNFNFQVDNLTKKVTFTNTSIYGVSYSWDFGDGSTSVEKTPVHNFAAAGNYNVTLHVTGLAGNVIDYTAGIPITN